MHLMLWEESDALVNGLLLVTTEQYEYHHNLRAVFLQGEGGEQMVSVTRQEVTECHSPCWLASHLHFLKQVCHQQLCIIFRYPQKMFSKLDIIMFSSHKGANPDEEEQT